MGDPGWSVEPLGGDSYEFVWPTGYYRTVFSVSDEGVIALDPISRDAAAAYRDAIASVTDQPVTYIVYSHEHLDHIVGAEVLAPDAQIVGHKDLGANLTSRGITGVPLPTVLVEGHRRLRLGEVTWELYDLGPNHSRTNLAVVNRADRWAALIDVIAGGLVPYRNLPVTDFVGTMRSLETLDAFDDVDVTLDGHCPPAPREWIDNYRRYYRDLLDAAAAARAEVNEVSILNDGDYRPEELADGVAMTDRMFDETAALAVERLRPAYGAWGGFERWAPMNVDRALIYLITGE
ncbi:MBL fold metallo-hydrolase [Nonomuraea cavernae]|uniref:MBL fold metallo-hydrolase n=1 Tax=Nonomuraea cavernae TaxID=2045107 RepID=UPI0033C1939A